jgi:hypothetical protein
VVEAVQAAPQRPQVRARAWLEAPGRERVAEHSGPERAVSPPERAAEQLGLEAAALSPERVVERRFAPALPEAVEARPCPAASLASSM